MSLRFVKILTRAVKKFSWFTLIRSYQYLIKIYHEMLVIQDLGKMFQVWQEVSISCMSYQGVPSFSSLGSASREC